MQKLKKQFFIALSLGLLIILAACEKNHVFEPNKYNRSSAAFAKPITNRGNLVVCTNQVGSKGKEIAQNIAKQECAKFGKRAVYHSYSVATCPLTIPNSWHFNCIAP
ncbi:MAG: hypothetical protein ACK5MJ_04240 [Alphaproteobacteria bacterium]